MAYLLCTKEGIFMIGSDVKPSTDEVLKIALSYYYAGHITSSSAEAKKYVKLLLVNSTTKISLFLI